VHDSLLEVSGTSHFKSFIDKLYCICHFSPKNRYDLQATASDLDVRLLSIGRLLDTRWVASSVRTLKAVFQSYLALYPRLMSASQDGTRDSKERSCHYDLVSKLTSNEFLLNIAPMLDALQELAELSVELQKRNLLLYDAHRTILRQIKVFAGMFDNSRTYSLIASEAVGQHVFKDVPLHAGGKADVLINSRQLYRSLAENMKNRLFVCQSSHSSYTSNECSELDYTDCVKVLYPVTGLTTPMFDLVKTRSASCVLGLVLVLDPLLEPSGHLWHHMERLLKMNCEVSSVAVIPESTAECERGFSAMILLLTSRRSTLHVTTFSSLLFLEMVGPPLEQFQPLQYVKSWFAKRHHAASDVGCKTHLPDSIALVTWP